VDIASGICPSCETTGNATTPCPQTVCARRGYHFVPAEYYVGNSGTDPLVGRKADEYLIARRIGKGGFGSVYLALQLPILLKCALKVLHDSIEDQPGGEVLMSKFRGEAEALARLNHPNIVRLIRFGEFDRRPYLVMEFIEGRSLRDEMQKAVAGGRCMARPVVDKLMVQMLHGLEAAHSISIVHRDMKPENVLLQSVVGNPWYVRIVDFGLAKFTSAGTHTSVLSGTPAYMAPEQLVGQGISPASDVYALGIMAYELMTGRRMYVGESQDSILASKLNPSYCPFDAVDRTGLTDGELSLLQRATCHRSEDRFKTAGAMLDAWQKLGEAREQNQVVTVPVPRPAQESTPSLPLLSKPAMGAGDATPATALGGTLQKSKGLRAMAWAAVGLAIAAAAMVVLVLSGLFGSAKHDEADARSAAVVVSSSDAAGTGPVAARSAGLPLLDAEAASPAGIDVRASEPYDARLPDVVRQPDLPPVHAQDVGHPAPMDAGSTGGPLSERLDDVKAPAPDVSAVVDDARSGDSAHVGVAGGASSAGGSEKDGKKDDKKDGKKDGKKGDKKGDKKDGKKDGKKDDAVAGPVTIRLETVPAGALVYAGNKPIGETPTSLKLEKGEKAVLRIERAGFKSLTYTVSGETDLRKTFELEPDSF
jgi:serine/threonine protein kinase